MIEEGLLNMSWVSNTKFLNIIKGTATEKVKGGS